MPSQIDPNVDLYATLGVKADASDAEIKRAYRKLAKKYHPDATGGDKAKESRFKEVSSAYDVLGDAKKRAHYDELRRGPRMPPGFGEGGQPWRGERQGGFNVGGLGVNFGAVFSQMFADAGAGPGRGAGPGVRYQVFTDDGPIDAEELFGRQARGGARGGRRRPQRPAEPAPERKVQASDGTPLTVRGNDVHSDVRVQIDQAILGTIVDVATLDGRATVKVPPGTASGMKLRLRGKGIEGGDHYVTVQIDVPRKLDDEGKRLLVELMKRARGG